MITLLFLMVTLGVSTLSWLISRNQAVPAGVRFVARGVLRYGTAVLAALATMILISFLFMAAGLKDG